MKTNLVIDDNIYINNCDVKVSGFATYWHINSNEFLEKMLGDDHIVFTTLESKQYTGNVTIYRDEGEIAIALNDLDFLKQAAKYERRYLYTGILVMLSIIGVIAILDWILF